MRKYILELRAARPDSYPIARQWRRRTFRSLAALEHWIEDNAAATVGICFSGEWQAVRVEPTAQTRNGRPIKVATPIATYPPIISPGDTWRARTWVESYYDGKD